MTYLVIDQALREAPGYWDRVEIRRLATLRREVNLSGTARLLSLSASEGVQPRPDDGGRQLPSADTVMTYWLVRPDDLVFNPMWAIEGGVAVSHIEGAVSPAYRVYKLGQGLSPRFLHHFLRSRPARDQYRAMVRGVTTFDRSVTREDFEAMPIPLPPLREQRAIATFLDGETARIDAVIAKKRRLDDLVRARLSVLIGTTTTEGKPMQVRRVISLRTSGPRGWAGRVGSSGAPFIRSANLQVDSIDIRWEGMAFVQGTESHEAERSRVRVGDVLVGITGANTGWVGFAERKHDGAYVSQHVGLLRARDVHPKWLAYSVFSPASRDQLLGGQYGGTKQQLSLDELAELVIHVPSPERQKDLVSHLDRQVATVDRLRTRLRHQIELLAEHRQALITAAVTGQLNIPGVAA